MLSQKLVSPVNKRTLEYTFILLVTLRDLIVTSKNKKKQKMDRKPRHLHPALLLFLPLFKFWICKEIVV